MNIDHDPDPRKPTGAEPNWEQELLTRLAFASLVEQRRSRRWGIFFKFGIFLYLVAVALLYLPGDWSLYGEDEKHTALVDINGVISADSDASADKVVAGLRDAFKDDNTAGVILRINSPGGSPVQSGYINDEIGRLRRKHPKIPLYAVIGDVCASGGYYIAVAADEIYADKSSVVGSIGVLMNGFGFVAAMDKLGIERRLLTAGEHKGLLDPFSPLRDEEVGHLRSLLTELHGQFIDAVKKGRGDRLKSSPDLFSGLVWTGEKSVSLGLVDGLASSGKVAREVIGAKKIVNFTRQRDYVERLAERLGTSLAVKLSKTMFDTGLR